jgi:hypothetical protein
MDELAGTRMTSSSLFPSGVMQKGCPSIRELFGGHSSLKVVRAGAAGFTGQGAGGWLAALVAISPTSVPSMTPPVAWLAIPPSRRPSFANTFVCSLCTWAGVAEGLQGSIALGAACPVATPAAKTPMAVTVLIAFFTFISSPFPISSQRGVLIFSSVSLVPRKCEHCVKVGATIEK